jgi:hypothetical protein
LSEVEFLFGVGLPVNVRAVDFIDGRAGEYAWQAPTLGDNLTVVTWKTLTDLLAYEFRRVRMIPVVSFGFAVQPVVSTEDLQLEELTCAERVDAIVRDFARTRRWPSLDEKARFFLRERIRFAYEYSSIAEISVFRPISIATRPRILNEQRRLLEWLLIDVWRSAGVANWLLPFLMMEESGNLKCQGKWELDISA